HVEVTLRNGEWNACHGKRKARTSRRTTREREENDRQRQRTAGRASRTSSMCRESRRLRARGAGSRERRAESILPRNRDSSRVYLFRSLVKGYSAARCARVDIRGPMTRQDTRDRRRA